MVRRDQVILVDREDQAIGEMEKMQAHREGLLHRAFSIFIFNNAGQMLIHQRAASKYHGAGLWTNACCSHPQRGEVLAAAAAERLDYEMGIQCDVAWTFSFIYCGKVENDLIEHEFDHVFVGLFDGEPKLNSDEVAQYQWINIEALNEWIAISPEDFTIWFREALPMLLEETSNSLGA